MQIQIMYLHTLMPRPKQPLHETLVADARAAVEACAGWNARLAARRITGFLNRRMRDSSVTLAQFGLMAQIAAARDGALSELAQRTASPKAYREKGAEPPGGASRLEAGGWPTGQAP